MEQRIRERYSEAMVEEAGRRYGIPEGRIHPLNAFESFMFEFERDGQGYILRLGHSLRRSEELIAGEADWINFLAEGGVPVARAICSENDRLVEAIEDGQSGHFLTTAFVKAQGVPPWTFGWSPALYETYGRLLGGMHARTISYQPGDPSWKRPEWDDEIFEFVDHFLPKSEKAARQKYQAVLKYIRNLPKGDGDYGLIHQDAHGSNFLVDPMGRITLFDFDDCGYSWFINDIAIVLFYMTAGENDPATLTSEFMTHFLRGYRQIYSLDPAWLREIPHFLKLREIELYAVIHRDFDVANIDNAWCARFMEGRKERIEEEAPFIEFDFEALRSEL